MNYYQVNFLSAPADEGDEWAYKQFQKCEYCELNYVKHFSEFLVPEDTVDVVQAEVWEPVNDLLLQVAGVIIGEISLVDKMRNAGLTGFEIKKSQVICIEDETINLPKYQWIFVTGRCHISDIWDKIISVCPHCGTTKTEKTKANDRKTTLTTPLPKDDLCRCRDRRGGLIVSEKFVDFINTNWKDYSNYIQFDLIPVNH